MAEKLEMDFEDDFDTAYEKIQIQVAKKNEEIDAENREALLQELQEINSRILEAEAFLRRFSRDTVNQYKIDRVERLLQELAMKKESIQRALDRLPRPTN